MSVSLNYTVTREDFLLSVTTVRPRSSFVILVLLPDFHNWAITYSLLIALMMEVVSTSKTSVNFHKTTRRNNQEDSHIKKFFACASIRFVLLHIS
jgi:hypothetical protein